jgi:hypothetical protein
VTEPALTNEELTEAVKYLRQKLESLEERMTTHGHNVLGDTTGTPVQWVPPSKHNPTPAEAGELVEKALRVARKYGSPLPSRLSPK